MVKCILGQENGHRTLWLEKDKAVAASGCSHNQQSEDHHFHALFYLFELRWKHSGNKAQRLLEGNHSFCENSLPNIQFLKIVLFAHWYLATSLLWLMVGILEQEADSLAFWTEQEWTTKIQTYKKKSSEAGREEG